MGESEQRRITTANNSNAKISRAKINLITVHAGSANNAGRPAQVAKIFIRKGEKLGVKYINVLYSSIQI